jgi:hypothetical protein
LSQIVLSRRHFWDPPFWHKHLNCFGYFRQSWKSNRRLLGKFIGRPRAQPAEHPIGEPIHEDALPVMMVVSKSLHIAPE